MCIGILNKVHLRNYTPELLFGYLSLHEDIYIKKFSREALHLYLPDEESKKLLFLIMVYHSVSGTVAEDYGFQWVPYQVPDSPKQNS